MSGCIAACGASFRPEWGPLLAVPNAHIRLSSPLISLPPLLLQYAVFKQCQAFGYFIGAS